MPRVGSRARSVADVSGFCLSAATEHTEAAADFLTFASGERGSTILSQTGEVVSAHVPTLNSLAFTQPGEAPASVGVFDESVERCGSPRRLGGVALAHPLIRTTIAIGCGRAGRSAIGSLIVSSPRS